MAQRCTTTNCSISQANSKVTGTYERTMRHLDWHLPNLDIIKNVGTFEEFLGASNSMCGE